MSADGTGSVSVGSVLSSLVVGGSLLFTISGCFLSLFTRNKLFSAVSDRLLSLVTEGGFLSVVFGCPSYLVTSGGPLSAVLGRFSSFFASGSLLSANFSGSSLSLILPVGSQVLFLTSISFCARRFSLLFLPLFYFSLPSSPTPLARNLASLTNKRLFNQAFII